MWLQVNNTANIYEICMTVSTSFSSSSGYWCSILTSKCITPRCTQATRNSKCKGNTELLKLTPSSPSFIYPTISLHFPRGHTHHRKTINYLMLPSQKQIIKGRSPKIISTERVEKEGPERKTPRRSSQRKEIEIFLNTAVSNCRGTVTVLTHFSRSNKTLLYHSITLTFNRPCIPIFLPSTIPPSQTLPFVKLIPPFTLVWIYVSQFLFALSLFCRSHCHWKPRSDFVPVVSMLNFLLLYLL